MKNKRLLYLIIFIVCVVVTCSVLTIIYSEPKDNQEESNVALETIKECDEVFEYSQANIFATNNSTIYQLELIKNKVIINELSFQNADELGTKLTFEFNNLCGKEITLDKDYRLFIYDASNKILKTVRFDKFPILRGNGTTPFSTYVAVNANAINRIEINKAD